MLFFGGVTYGAKERTTTEQPVVEVEIEETHPIIEVEEKEMDILQSEEDPVVNRTASVLEKIVATFYDACIQIMYQFVSLFFD